MASLTIQSKVGPPRTYAPHLRIVCILVLVGILVVGLWPFHTPRNNVRWTGAGLWLGKYGIVMSTQPFRDAASQGQTPCSFEIWLEPARVDKTGTILAYYQPDDPANQILLRQFNSNLVFARGDLNFQRRGPFIGIYAANVFRKHEPVLLSITTGEAGTAVYTNGTLVQRSSIFKFSADELTGQLMFGNAPGTVNTWSGTIRGFATYRRELSPDEVARHYDSWMQHDEKILASSKNAVAVYPFSEGRGNVLHNLVDPSTHLEIPDRFFVPHKQFLEAPWDEFYPNWSYWKSVILNVVGFVPLGFFFYALYSEMDLRQSLSATIILGFLVSLTIEVLQGFLPTRSSGITDLMTNTFGTALGAFGYSNPAVRSWLVKVARQAGISEGVWPNS